MAKLVEFENEIYSSVLAAATAAGVAPNTMKRWLKRGYTSKAQAIAADSRGTLCTFGDEEYESISAAARANGVAWETMKRWVAEGYTSKEQALAARWKGEGNEQA